MIRSSFQGEPTRPIRVCFVIDTLGPGGTESQLLTLIRRVDRSKIEPYLCLLDGHDPQSVALEPDGCPTLRLGVRKLHRPSSLPAAWRFVRFLRRERIDVVQALFPDSTHFAVPLAKLAGVRHVVRTRRNLGHDTTPTHRRMGRLLGRLVEVTVANCQACRRAVIQQEAAAPNSVLVLENGIDLVPFERIAPVTPNGNGRPRIVGMVANLRPIKAPDVFVRAAGILAASHPDVTFRMAGTGDEAAVRRLAERCGITDRLSLDGHVCDVASFLAGLDVAVLTSHAEGLSNAVLEYMAAGRPMVLTAVGGNPELVEDGVHGLLVPPGDPQAVVGAVDRLLRDPVLAARLGSAARSRVIQRNSLDAMVRRHETLYRGLVQGHDKVPGTGYQERSAV